jgi:NAD(P)-dependent dehydrogenase (short-subunit alcohol dehydrogenase family)
VLCRFVEWRVATVLGRVHVRASREEETADLDVPSRRGRVQRLVRKVVPRVGRDAGPGFEQYLDGLGLAEERGQVQCREAIRGVGHRGIGHRGEAILEAIEPAERRRLEEIELRIGGEQHVQRRSVESVASEQNGRHAILAPRRGQRWILGEESSDRVSISARDGSHQLSGVGHRKSLHPGAYRAGTMAPIAAPADARQERDPPTMRLADKVTIITGGGGGMGRVAAQVFAREGARVVVAEYGEVAGQETVELVRAAGGDASFVKADVSSEADAKAMVDHALATYGRLDCLYNNAGIMPEADHSVTDTSVDVWDQVMAVNVRGVFLGCKYAIPAMEAGGGGSIINIASFVALVGCSVPQDAYTASKGALLSLTRSLAVQFGPKGIRTNAICPGPVETPLLMDWLVKDEEAKRIRLARNPTGRFGKPEEIVNMAVYLASDESRWTNGASLVVDGGISVNYF